MVTIEGHELVVGDLFRGKGTYDLLIVARIVVPGLVWFRPVGRPGDSLYLLECRPEDIEYMGHEHIPEEK